MKRPKRHTDKTPKGKGSLSANALLTESFQENCKSKCCKCVRKNSHVWPSKGRPENI